MKMLNQVLCFSLLVLSVGWQDSQEVKRQESFQDYALEFKTLYQNIGDSLITPDSAARAFQSTFLKLSDWRKGDLLIEDSEREYYFPIRGYLPQYSIGGRGKGFRPTGFDLFNSRVRKSHPAHDMFIRDGNQDSVDDRMCMPVEVLAFTSGIVLDVKKGWTPESEWRGGNYVWIYDPIDHALVYYAHNDSVSVAVGDWVQAGDPLGTVGRTGFNAMQPRSGTHLHMMYLKINENQLPEPVNTYPWLLNATVTKW